MPTYFARDEKALRIAAMPPVVNGRLQGTAAVDIADLNNAADKRSAPAQYELFGPGDVVRLGGGAITRRFPAPGSSDAEETKVALVEFGAIDLPWRYAPEAAAGERLRPCKLPCVQIQVKYHGWADRLAGIADQVEAERLHRGGAVG